MTCDLTSKTDTQYLERLSYIIRKLKGSLRARETFISDEYLRFLKGTGRIPKEIDLVATLETPIFWLRVYTLVFKASPRLFEVHFVISQKDGAIVEEFLDTFPRKLAGYFYFNKNGLIDEPDKEFYENVKEYFLEVSKTIRHGWVDAFKQIVNAAEGQSAQYKAPWPNPFEVSLFPTRDSTFIITSNYPLGHFKDTGVLVKVEGRKYRITSFASKREPWRIKFPIKESLVIEDPEEVFKTASSLLKEAQKTLFNFDQKEAVDRLHRLLEAKTGLYADKNTQSLFHAYIYRKDGARVLTIFSGESFTPVHDSESGIKRAHEVKIRYYFQAVGRPDNKDLIESTLSRVMRGLGFQFSLRIDPTLRILDIHILPSKPTQVSLRDIEENTPVYLDRYLFPALEKSLVALSDIVS